MPGIVCELDYLDLYQMDFTLWLCPDLCVNYLFNSTRNQRHMDLGESSTCDQ